MKDGPSACCIRIDFLSERDELDACLFKPFNNLDDFITLADPDSGLGPGDDVTIDLRGPLFFDAAGERVRA